MCIKVFLRNIYRSDFYKDIDWPLNLSSFSLFPEVKKLGNCCRRNYVMIQKMEVNASCNSKEVWIYFVFRLFASMVVFWLVVKGYHLGSEKWSGDGISPSLSDVYIATLFIALNEKKKIYIYIWSIKIPLNTKQT